MPIAFPPGKIGPDYAPNNDEPSFTSGFDISNVAMVGSEFSSMSLAPGMALDYNTSRAVNLRNMGYQYEAIDFGNRPNPVPAPLMNDGAFVLQFDWAASNREIVGVTRTSTGTVLSNCVIDLFETGSDLVRGRTVSGADGSFNFGNPGTGPFYLVAYKTGSPDVAGTTVNTVMPTAFAYAVASPPASVLRFASALNARCNYFRSISTVRKKMMMRIKVVIGSSDFSSLNIRFQSTYLQSGGDNALGNDYYIEKCALEKETGGAAFTPVLFSGARTATVVDGGGGLTSDPILPGDFGLGAFTQGHVYWIRALVSVTGDTHQFPIGGTVGTNGTAFQFDPTTYSASDADATGTISFTGSGSFSFGASVSPIVIGTPVTPTAKFISTLGDSIVEGTGDTAAASGWVYGFAQRSLFDADFASNVRAGCTLGRSGSTAAGMWTGPLTETKSILAHGNVAVEEWGTNSPVYADSAVVWSYLKSVGQYVIRTKLLTQTTSTDSWATTANQTKTANYTTPTGNRIVFNGDIAAQEGILYDKFVSFDAAVLHTDRDLWKAPGYTTDGLHPTATAHEAMAAVMRTAYTTLP